MKQLTFSKPTTCTHIYTDGHEERVRYGQYEAIQIIKENGWDVHRTKILTVPTYLVTEVTRYDGVKVIFDEPFYCIEAQEYGDGSGRLARSI
jgi:hypothetical protein